MLQYCQRLRAASIAFDSVAVRQKSFNAPLLIISDGGRRAVVASSIRRAWRPALHITKVSYNQVEYLPK
jgi:hypothetical protein